MAEKKAKIETIKVKDPNGNEHEVTEKAFDVIYAGQGYKKVAARKKAE